MISRFVVLAAALLLAGPVIGAPPPSPAPPSEADWRTPDPQNVLVIDTNKGRIFVELTPLAAPKSVAQVRDLARTGFYDGRAFFRVIDGFMDQTGDPQDNGQGGSTKPNLRGEFTFRRDGTTPMVIFDSEGGREKGFMGALPVMSQPAALGAMTVDHTVGAAPLFCAGVVGMARAQDPDSGNSQFFLMRDTQHNLDGQYTAIGRVIAGEDVVKSIKIGEPVAPPQDRMTKVRVMADIPPAERPNVRVIDTAGPWFAAEVARVKAEKLVGLSPCDLSLPSQLK
ncbi:MAG TPA: peptidylprolyl isomerase [Caulobacteraceae bacterium]|jgi:peptidylprolyl isomerase